MVQGVWGYNEESIKFVPDGAAAAAGVSDRDATENGLTNQFGSDSVSNRVAGMALKATLMDHKDAVTGIICFSIDNRHWMISTGWDRRICIWDLHPAKLHDIFRSSDAQHHGTSREELAADGIILSLDYSPERNEFGYSSSDKLAYIRKFSPNGSEMSLVAVLQGHEAEVTQIRWHRKEKQWITASEDRSLRIWASA
eukprot:jgi/Hompol1/3892/HPOL_006806-RA